VSEGAEIEEDSPPSLEGVVVEPLLVPNRVATKEEVAEREWRRQFHREKP
jgi:hypothetical protein